MVAQRGFRIEEMPQILLTNIDQIIIDTVNFVVEYTVLHLCKKSKSSSFDTLH